MNQVKDANYNLDVIIEKLKNGVTMNTIANFYNVSEATIINDIKEYLKLKDANDVRNYIRAIKSRFNKPLDRSIIRYAKYYKGKGYTYSQFLEMLKKSERPFSESAKLLAKSVFESNNVQDNQNNSNKSPHKKDSKDEIEM